MRLLSVALRTRGCCVPDARRFAREGEGEVGFAAIMGEDETLAAVRVAVGTTGAPGAEMDRGNVNEIAVPDGPLSAQMRPPCASTNALQIASPNPVPPLWFRV